MLCPNCGTKTKTEHKFCRNCGMNLEPVSQALSAHLSHGGGAAARSARAAERRVVRRMLNGLFAGVIVILFGVLLMAFLPGRGFRFLGVAAALIGIFVALVSVLSPLRSMDDDAAEPAPPSQNPEGAAATGRLLHENTVEPVQTNVTDHTTELLGVEVKGRDARE